MSSMLKAMILSGAVILGLGVNPVSAQHGHGAHDHGAHGHGSKMHGEASGHSHEQAEVHGGLVTMSKEFHVETVFMPNEVRLYLYDGSQNPMHVKHWKSGLVEATGTVDYRDRGRSSTSLEFVRAAPGGYVCPMHAEVVSNKPGECPKCEMTLVKNDIKDGTLWSCPMHPDENGKSAGTCDECGMKYMPQDYLSAPVDLSGLKTGDARVTFNLKNLPGTSEKTLRFTEKLIPSKMPMNKMPMEHMGKMHEHKGHGDHGH